MCSESTLAMTTLVLGHDRRFACRYYLEEVCGGV